MNNIGINAYNDLLDIYSISMCAKEEIGKQKEILDDKVNKAKVELNRKIKNIDIKKDKK